VQESRKSAGLDVSDRIRLFYFSDMAGVLDGMGEYGGLIKSTTLATALELAASRDGLEKLDGAELWFRIEKV
jgi:hypothetical protein